MHMRGVNHLHQGVAHNGGLGLLLSLLRLSLLGLLHIRRRLHDYSGFMQLSRKVYHLGLAAVDLIIKLEAAFIHLGKTVFSLLDIEF